jgi:hypothetical protein
MNIRPFESPEAEILYFTTVAPKLTNYFSNRYQYCILSIFERGLCGIQGNLKFGGFSTLKS